MGWVGSYLAVSVASRAEIRSAGGAPHAGHFTYGRSNRDWQSLLSTRFWTVHSGDSTLKSRHNYSVELTRFA